MDAPYNSGVSRLARFLLALASNVCLVACAVLILLWGRSYFVTEKFWVTRRLPAMLPGEFGDSSTLTISQGSVRWLRLRADDVTSPRFSIGWQHESLGIDSEPIWPSWWTLPTRTVVGFHASKQASPAVAFRAVPAHVIVVVLPLWSLVLLTAILPFARAARRWRTSRELDRRVDDNFCIACGYDLTGNVSDVCPECGSPRSVH